MSCCAVLFSTALPALEAAAGDYEDIIFVNGFELSVRPEIGEIVIVEIMADPVAVTDANGEWFEFVNTNPKQTLDIGGCFVNNGSSLSTQLPPLLITGGQRVVMARNLDVNTNGNVVADASFDFSLPNGGGTLVFECDETELDSVSWTSSSPGQSWSLDPAFTDPDLNDDPASWCFSSTPPYNDGGDFGTPGQMNIDCPTAAPRP